MNAFRADSRTNATDLANGFKLGPFSPHVGTPQPLSHFQCPEPTEAQYGVRSGEDGMEYVPHCT